MMIRTINKSAYQRTVINKTATVAFKTEGDYIAWLKANPNTIIHSVENTNSGLITVTYS
jgi:hypothetical protein